MPDVTPDGAVFWMKVAGYLSGVTLSAIGIAVGVLPPLVILPIAPILIMLCSFGIADVAPSDRIAAVFGSVAYIFGLLSCLYTGFLAVWHPFLDQVGFTASFLLGMIYSFLAFMCVDTILKPGVDRGDEM